MQFISGDNGIAIDLFDAPASVYFLFLVNGNEIKRPMLVKKINHLKINQI